MKEQIANRSVMVEIKVKSPRQLDVRVFILICTLHRYVHGNLTKSETFDGSGHEEKQSRVENLSRAATAIALLARRVASLIQV